MINKNLIFDLERSNDLFTRCNKKSKLTSTNTKALALFTCILLVSSLGSINSNKLSFNSISTSNNNNYSNLGLSNLYSFESSLSYDHDSEEQEILNFNSDSQRLYRENQKKEKLAKNIVENYRKGSVKDELATNEFEASINFIQDSSAGFFALQEGLISKKDTFNLLFSGLDATDKPALITINPTTFQLSVEFYYDKDLKNQTSGNKIDGKSKEKLIFSLSEFLFCNDFSDISVNVNYKEMFGNKISACQIFAKELVDSVDLKIKSDFISEKEGKLVYVLSRNNKQEYSMNVAEESEKAFFIVKILANKLQTKDKFKATLDKAFFEMVTCKDKFPLNIPLIDTFFFSKIKVSNSKGSQILDSSKAAIFPTKDNPSTEEFRVDINDKEDLLLITYNIGTNKGKEILKMPFNEIISLTSLAYQSLFLDAENCSVYSWISISSPKVFAELSTSPELFSLFCVNNANISKDQSIDFAKLYNRIFNISLFIRLLKSNIENLNMKSITNEAFLDNQKTLSLKTLGALEQYPYYIDTNFYSENDDEELKFIKLRLNMERLIKTYFFVKELPVEDFFSDLLTRHKTISFANMTPKLLSDLLSKYFKSKVNEKGEKGKLDKFSLTQYYQIMNGIIENLYETQSNEVKIKVNSAGTSNSLSRMEILKEFFLSHLSPNTTVKTYKFFSYETQKAIICLLDNNLTFTPGFLGEVNQNLLLTENEKPVTQTEEYIGVSDEKVLELLIRLKNARTVSNTPIASFLLATCDSLQKDKIYNESKNLEEVFKTLDQQNFNTNIKRFFNESVDEEKLSSLIQLNQSSAYLSDYTSYSSVNYVLPIYHNIDYRDNLLKEDNSYSGLFLDKDNISLYRVNGKSQLLKHLNSLFSALDSNALSIIPSNQVDILIQKMKRKVTRIGKVERASGNKPRTIVDIKEVSISPIVDPSTLKIISSDIMVTNVSQTADELTYVSNQSLPDFCTVQDKQALIDKFSLSIKVDKINICGSLEVVDNKIITSVPIFKSEYYQLLKGDKETLIGYRMVKNQISREMAKKLALPNYKLYPTEMNTKRLGTADVFLSLNFFGDVDGIKYVDGDKTTFIKDKSLIELAKAKVDSMKLKLNLEGKSEYDEKNELNDFNRYSETPEDSVENFFVTDAQLENYFSINPHINYNFLIQKAFSENLLSLAGILNLYQCPGVFNSSSTSSSNLYKTYSNDSLLPIYYYFCYSKYIKDSFKVMFKSLNFSDFSVKTINSSKSLTCTDENNNNTVPIPKEVFDAIFKNYSKVEDKKETVKKEDEKVVTKADVKEENKKLNQLIEQIIAELAAEKEKEKNSNNNSLSTSFNVSTFKAEFEKVSDEDIAKYQNYLKEGVYVDSDNNLRTLADSKIVLKHSKLIILNKFKIMKRVIYKTFITGYNFIFKQVELKDLIVNLKGEISVVEELEITPCGELKYVNNPFNNDFNKLKLPAITAFNSYLKILPTLKYGEAIINTDGEFLRIKGFKINHLLVLENSEYQVSLDQDPVNNMKDILRKNYYTLLDTKRILYDNDKVFYDGKEINVDELTLNLNRDIIRVTRIEVQRLSGFKADSDGNIYLTIGRQVSLDEIKLKGYSVINDSVVVDSNYKVKDNYIVREGSTNEEYKYNIEDFIKREIVNKPSRLTSKNSSSLLSTTEQEKKKPIVIVKKEIVKLDLRNVTVDPKRKVLISITKNEYPLEHVSINQDSCKRPIPSCLEKYSKSLNYDSKSLKSFSTKISLNINGDIVANELVKINLLTRSPDFDDIKDIAQPPSIFYQVNGNCELLRYSLMPISNNNNSNNSVSSNVAVIIKQIQQEINNYDNKELLNLMNFNTIDIKNIKYSVSIIDTNKANIVINPIGEIFTTIPVKMPKDSQLIVENVKDSTSGKISQIIRVLPSLDVITNFNDVVSVDMRNKRLFVIDNALDISFPGLKVDDNGIIVNSDGKKYESTSLQNDIDKEFYNALTNKIDDKNDIEKVVYGFAEPYTKYPTITGDATKKEEEKKNESKEVAKSVDVDISDKDKDKCPKGSDNPQCKDVKDSKDIIKNDDKTTTTDTKKDDKTTTTDTKKDDKTTTTDTKKDDKTTTTETKKDDKTTTSDTKKDDKTTTETKKDDKTTTSDTKKDDKTTTTDTKKDDKTTTTETKKDTATDNKEVKKEDKKEETKKDSQSSKELEKQLFDQTPTSKDDTTKKDETKKDDTKKEETKKDETKKEETKKDETKKDETKKDDTKKEESPALPSSTEPDKVPIDNKSPESNYLARLFDINALDKLIEVQYIAEFPLSGRTKEKQDSITTNFKYLENLLLKSTNEIDLYTKGELSKIKNSDDGKKINILFSYVKTKSQIFDLLTKTNSESNLNSLSTYKSLCQDALYYLLTLKTYYLTTEENKELNTQMIKDNIEKIDDDPNKLINLVKRKTYELVQTLLSELIKKHSSVTTTINVSKTRTSQDKPTEKKQDKDSYSEADLTPSIAYETSTLSPLLNGRLGKAMQEVANSDLCEKKFNLS